MSRVSTGAADVLIAAAAAKATGTFVPELATIVRCNFMIAKAGAQRKEEVQVSWVALLRSGFEKRGRRAGFREAEKRWYVRTCLASAWTPERSTATKY